MFLGTDWNKVYHRYFGQGLPAKSNRGNPQFLWTPNPPGRRGQTATGPLGDWGAWVAAGFCRQKGSLLSRLSTPRALIHEKRYNKINNVVIWSGAN